MTPSNHILFIADLHLDAAQTDTVELALQFFTDAQGAAELYILGDLVEYWLGDDAGDPRLQPVFDSLAALSASGTKLHLMHGNRDFLLGEQFAASIGAVLHTQDTVMITLGDQHVLLLHGDTLCTDDVEYQGLRQMLRHADWQAEFLGKSIPDRISAAQQLRERSRAALAGKTATIMDVNPAAVNEAFQQQRCDLMIHGHTHRPAVHSLNINGQQCQRFVVGDWKADGAKLVRWDGQTLSLETCQAS